MFRFFFQKDEPELQSLSEDEYRDIFIKGRSKEAIQSTYEKAWAAKNFEIENYWKRANYFWAFQVASFAGYFAVLNSTAYLKNPEVLYCVICIGLITSLAWNFINKGSKTWQRHWEIHVDMLEDEIVGPLYKIITTSKTYSVSKINEIVSIFIFFIWITLGIKYFVDNITFDSSKSTDISYVVILSTVFVIYFSGAMYFGHGRGRFGERKVRFYVRKYKPEKDESLNEKK